MDKAGKRIEVLLEWRDLVVAAGHAVPTVADMMRIGASGEVRPEGVDLEAVEPWADTIGHLLRQLRYGVPAPVSQIPDDLMEPSSTSGAAPRSDRGPRSTPTGTTPIGATGTTPTGTTPTGATTNSGSRGAYDPVLVALRAWWRTEQRTDLALRGLKEHHLRNIVMTGSRSEAEIRRHLPAPLANHARRIAEVIARVDGPATGDGATGMGATSAGATGMGTSSAGATGMGTSSAGATGMGTSSAGATGAGTAGSGAGTPRHATSDPPTRPRSTTGPRATGPAAAGPPPSPGPDPAADPGPTGADAELAGLELADYEFVSDPPAEPAPIRRRPGPNGTVLMWPKADVEAATVLYRVVSADDRWAPDRPQAADAVTVTESLRCVDVRPFTYAIRHVQVWVHAGRTREEAAAAEPVKHAECVVVAQVTDARVREDGRSVVGQWRVPDGVDAVEVLRVPWERSRRDGHSSSEYRLPASRPFTTGFVDDDAERGRRYVYELSVVVELDGKQVLSEPTKVDISVSAVLTAVTTLRHTDADGLSALHLEWVAPPGGEVRIYRTRKAPAAGLEERPQLVSVLHDAGLTEGDDVGRPIEHHADGTSSMADVSWPDGWTFAYLTPVTVLGDMAAVGPSTLVIRLGQVRDAKIVERTHRQILTFAWPHGADVVLAYVGGPDQTAQDARRGRPEEISRDQYVAQGGMYFRGRLPQRGCSVHLEPIAYSGRRTAGPIASLHYPGLLQLGYRVHTERDKAHRPVAVRVLIFAEVEQGGSPWFTLVHHQDRLPLHERDGHPLPVRAHGDPRPGEGLQFRPSALSHDPRDTFWYARIDGLTGYLRLFVCLPPEARSSVALFDPPIDQLYLGTPQAGS